jgi:hypothetical protein
MKSCSDCVSEVGNMFNCLCNLSVFLGNKICAHRQLDGKPGKSGALNKKMEERERNTGIEPTRS